MDSTHDPLRRSWVRSADDPAVDFPIQNLPFGVFRHGASAPRIGVAIGERVLDLAACQQAGLLHGEPADAGCACLEPSLNALMALGPPAWRALRLRLSDLLREDGDAGDRERASSLLVPQRDVQMLVPAAIGDYTDFYASVFHATNVGRLFRPDNPLLPNYKHVPVGYHGGPRPSSLVAHMFADCAAR
jgi:fumarylacetoacetase